MLWEIGTAPATRKTRHHAALPGCRRHLRHRRADPGNRMHRPVEGRAASRPNQQLCHFDRAGALRRARDAFLNVGRGNFQCRRQFSLSSPSFINGGAALADTGNLVDVLEAVDPKIGTNKNDLIAKSKALCTNINASDSDGRLQADAEKTFTYGTWVPSDAEAQAIVGTVKAYGGC